MAKLNSIIRFSGTLDGKTVVNSKAYGEHLRAARGTKSVAKVNDVLQHHTVLLTRANQLAKLIKDAIDPYRKDFPGGQLWQELVGAFKKLLKNEDKVHLSCLEGMDLNRNYVTGRLLKGSLRPVVSAGHDFLDVQFDQLQAVFKYAKYIDGYQLQLIAVFVDFEKGTTSSAMAESPVLSLDHTLACTFRLPHNGPGTQYLLILKVSGTEEGRIATGRPVKGMTIVHGGVLAESIASTASSSFPFK